jgi:carbon storage regulator
MGLVVTRKAGEQIMIGDNIVITVIHADRGQAKINIDAPREIRVDRAEVRARINLEKANASHEGMFAK